MAFRITFRTYVTGPEPNQGEGPCGDEARRSAEEPEAPSEAPKHIRAVMRSDSSELNERYPKRARSDYYPAHLFTGGEGSDTRSSFNMVVKGIGARASKPAPTAPSSMLSRAWR